MVCLLDGSCCPWCSKQAGRYRYPDETPEDVFKRHDNCTCDVSYVSEKGRQNAHTHQWDWDKGKNQEYLRQLDAEKKTKRIEYKAAGLDIKNVRLKRDAAAQRRERIEKAESAHKPVKLTRAEAQAKESEILAQRRLTYDRKRGIIQARGYQDDYFNRKTQLSTADEDLKAVNPNYGRISGYDDNCQRCVPTYVLRKQGYDVEALPTGQNESIDNLLKQNPHIIWQKAGSPVIPKSTRGSSYFGKPEIEKYMKDLPDGAMCEIRCDWKNEDHGHVFIAEKQNGKVRYIDPQNGKIDVSHYFKEMVEDSTTFWRIDNASFNDNLIKYCCKNKR